MANIITVIVIVVIFSIIQLGCHFEAKSLYCTRKQLKESERARERNRLFWSIRNLEEDIYGRWLS